MKPSEENSLDLVHVHQCSACGHYTFPEHFSARDNVRGLYECPVYQPVYGIVVLKRLSYFSDRPVKDMTGFGAGAYTFTLQWMNEQAQTAALEAGEKAMPTLSNAMEEQLGLKLEPRKAQIDMLVVDGLDKAPTEN